MLVTLAGEGKEEGNTNYNLRWQDREDAIYIFINIHLCDPDQTNKQ